jgi:membrane-bound lytic murein transglycosylase A
MQRFVALTAGLLLFLLVFACGRQPREPSRVEPEVDNALVIISVAASELPDFADDFSAESLVRAIDRQLAWFAAAERTQTWSFGEETVTAARIIATLERFRELWLAAEGNAEALRDGIAREFEVFQITFGGSPDILFTGYHSPILNGSLEPTMRFRYPLYRMPDDAVTIRPSLFDDRMLRKGTSIRHDRVVGRVDDATGEVIPYYTREEIDHGGVLAGRELEWVWLDDPFQAFLFHVQGGGFIRLPDDRYMKLNYAGKNSHPYTSIGKALVAEGVIPEEEISIQAIQRYFDANPHEVDRVLNLNKSYVFYHFDGRFFDAIEPDMYPTGVLGFPVTPKRSIATDKKFFPGGALAFIQGTQRLPEGGTRDFSGFAVDQDTGGAITYAHIDLFQGAGPEAEALAGLLKDDYGRLYFLLLKQADAG